MKTDQLYLENYSIEGLIGNGTFASVYRALNKVTNEPVALKVIDKSNINSSAFAESVAREIKLAQNIDHPYIIKGLEIIDKPDYLYIMMEYAPNGSLLNYLNKKGGLSEEEARDKFIQLVLAVQYLHNNGVAHRDLKLENILLDENNNVKLIDFGLANYYSEDVPLMSTTCGSIAYSAPEILRGELYTAAVDVWSCGVILYSMVLGYMPYRSMNSIKLARLIMETNPKYPNNLSPALIDLLHGLLSKDPQLRLTPEEILDHQWVSDYFRRNYLDNTLLLNSYPSKTLLRKRLSESDDSQIFNLGSLAMCPLIKMKTETLPQSSVLKNLTLKRTTTSSCAQGAFVKTSFDQIFNGAKIRCRTKTIGIAEARHQSELGFLVSMGRSELPKL